MKKLMKFAWIFLSISILLTACGKKETTPEPAAPALSSAKTVFTYVTSPLNVPSIVEKENQVFAKYLPGVRVEYAEITSGAEQSQALASGDVQILHAIGASSVVAAAAGGADIKVLNMYSRAPKAFALFSKDESLKSASSLVGKNIAGPAGTNLHELLVSYLEKEGLTIDDVNFVSMSIPDALAALDGGSIDVALLGGPAAYKAEKSGLHKITDGEGYIEAIICVATSEAYYKEHKDVIDAVLAAQEELRSQMKNNPQAVKETVKAVLQLDDEAYDTMSAQYDFALEISEKDLAGLQKTADFMLKNGMIKQAVDVKTLLIQK